MTTTDGFEWFQNDPLFHTSLVAVAEGLDGNGVLSTGDMEVTATANANEIQVATGDLWYTGDATTYSIGSAETHTLSDNTSGSDRWDLVVFDTGTGASAVVEGTPSSSPEPELPGSGQVVLAYVYVADGETDVSDSEIKNFRAFSTDAADVRLDDSAGDYSSTEVESALTEVIREAGDPLNGPLDLSSFSGSAPFDLGTNPGAFGAIVDMVVDSNSAQGTTHSYLLALDSTTLVEFYAESDGAGGLQNVELRLPEQVAIGSDLVTTGGTTVYDSANGNVPRPQVDDEKATTTVSSSTYTTSDEEVVFVDTSAIGGASTITLASADAVDGNTLVVSDLTGTAADNPITVDTEGSETIHGQSSKTIETNGGALVFTSDGSNWSLGGGGAGGGGGTAASEVFEGRESGSVSDTNQGVLVVDHLADGETVEVYKAVLVLSDGTAAPSNLDLELVTLDNSGAFTSQTVLITGDGSTIFDDETGDPLGSYTNSSGGGQTIAVVVDNQTGSSQSVMAVTEGETGL